MIPLVGNSFFRPAFQEISALRRVHDGLNFILSSLSFRRG